VGYGTPYDELESTIEARSRAYSTLPDDPKDHCYGATLMWYGAPHDGVARHNTFLIQLHNQWQSELLIAGGHF